MPCEARRSVHKKPLVVDGSLQRKPTHPDAGKILYVRLYAHVDFIARIDIAQIDFGIGRDEPMIGFALRTVRKVELKDEPIFQICRQI